MKSYLLLCAALLTVSMLSCRKKTESPVTAPVVDIREKHKGTYNVHVHQYEIRFNSNGDTTFRMDTNFTAQYLVTYKVSDSTPLGNGGGTVMVPAISFYVYPLDTTKAPNYFFGITQGQHTDELYGVSGVQYRKLAGDFWSPDSVRLNIYNSDPSGKVFVNNAIITGRKQ